MKGGGSQELASSVDGGGNAGSGVLSTRVKHLLILAYLVVQFVGPVHYYLYSDPYDERFAWRMYSPMRMVTCKARVSEGVGASQREIKLSREIGMPWVKGIRRGNLRVLDAYAEHRCASMRSEGIPAHVFAAIYCQLPDGSWDKRSDPSEDLCVQR